MKKKKWIAGSCFLLLFIATNAYGQKNEISISIGKGIMVGRSDSMEATVVDLSYARHITDHWGFEITLIDKFSYDNPSPDRDLTFRKLNYDGANIAALYHITSTESGKKFIPYLSGGIGFTSDDFTELPSYRVIRLGGGVKYFFDSDQRFGIKLELRNEIINQGSRIFPTGEGINLPNARVGFILRF